MKYTKGTKALVLFIGGLPFWVPMIYGLIAHNWLLVGGILWGGLACGFYAALNKEVHA